MCVGGIHRRSFTNLFRHSRAKFINIVEMQRCTRSTSLCLPLVFLVAVWCCPLLAATEEEQPPLHSLGSGVEHEAVDECAPEEGINAEVRVASIQFEEVSYALYVVGFVLLVVFAKMGELLVVPWLLL